MRTETGDTRADPGAARTNPIPARADPGVARTKACVLAPAPNKAVGSRQQAVGRGRKEKKISEVGENLVS